MNDLNPGTPGWALRGIFQTKSTSVFTLTSNSTIHISTPTITVDTLGISSQRSGNTTIPLPSFCRFFRVSAKLYYGATALAMAYIGLSLGDGSVSLNKPETQHDMSVAQNFDGMFVYMTPMIERGSLTEISLMLRNYESVSWGIGSFSQPTVIQVEYYQ